MPAEQFMQKLVIMLEPGENQAAFEEGWPSFLAAAETLPGLRREATIHVESILAGSLPYSLIHELYFDNMEAMRKALESPQGKEAGTRLQAITRGRALLFYADHHEDSAENLERMRNVGPDS